MTAATAKLVALLKPKRTWVQFRLRTLFVLVLVAAVPCGWLKWKIDRKQKERAAVAEINKLGGQVYYDWYDWQTSGHPAEPPGPVWLRKKVLGNDFFASVVFVWIGFDVTDDSLVHLETLVNLEKLRFWGKGISDAGIIHLRRLTRLKNLNLGGAAVTNAGLIHLSGLTNLQDLNLAETNVSDAGLDHLRAMTRLEQLSLTGTDVSDAGLVSLKGLVRLRILKLTNTNVTAAGVAELQKVLPKCKIIR